MVETAVALPNSNTFSSLQLDDATWIDQSEDRLAEERYPQKVNFAPGQIRYAAGTEAKAVGSSHGEGRITTVLSFDDTLISRPLGPLPKPRRLAIFHALQEWEGVVLEIGEEKFTARLSDLTAESTSPPAGTHEEADIPFSEISDGDIQRMCPGSIFRWVIGYERSASGTKRRVSQIVFRDLPVMTGRDLSLGEEWATQIRQGIQD